MSHYLCFAGLMLASASLFLAGHAIPACLLSISATACLVLMDDGSDE